MVCLRNICMYKYPALKEMMMMMMMMMMIIIIIIITQEYLKY